MGKRIISQRRGRGSPTYRANSHRFKGRPEYKEGIPKVIDIINDPGRDPPLAKVKYENGEEGLLIAAEGIKVGDVLESGNGCVLPLSKIPVGTQIFGIETYPNSGPKLCRTAGSAAILLSKSEKECIIKLPSKKQKSLNPNCRATIGVPAGSGRNQKPWMKAGKKWIAMHARGKLYPITKGVSMNSVSHPFGGGGTGKRRPPVSRFAPPGRKVGSVAARRTGKKKR